MTSPLAAPVPRAIHRTLCVALMGVFAWRFTEIAPNWIGGVAPAYPGQYEARLLSAITGIGILGASLIAQSTTLHTLRGRVAYWTLLGAALAALVGQILTDR